MRRYIGVELSKIVDDKKCGQMFLVYDLEKKLRNVDDMYVFKFNDDYVMEKSEIDDKNTGTSQYTCILTECNENDPINIYVEHGKYNIELRNGMPTLIEIDDGEKKSLEIFPKQSNRTMFFELKEKKNLDLVSLKIGSYNEWKMDICVNKYREFLANMDSEMLSEFVKFYAKESGSAKEVCIKVVDTETKQTRKAYKVNGASKDEAFIIIKNHLITSAAKMKMLDVHPEILDEITDFN